LREEYIDYYNYLFDNLEDKTYPDYKFYDIKINPPNLEVNGIKYMNADEKGFCPSCWARGMTMKMINEHKRFYSYSATSYSNGLVNAGKSKIEVDPNPLSESLNDFVYFITFDGMIGYVNYIIVSLDPPEGEILKMSFDEMKGFNRLVEQVNVSSIYPALANNNVNCFWFYPWQMSHNFYNITVPHGMVNYTYDGKSNCNVSVTSSGNKININADCRLFTDLCPTDQRRWEGLYRCNYSKVEVCFN